MAVSLPQEIHLVIVGARDRTPSITAWWSRARKHYEAIDSGQLDRGVATSDNLASRSPGVCFGAVGWEIAGKRCDKQVARKPPSDGRVAGGGVTGVLCGIDVTGVLRGVLGVVSNGEWR